MPKHMAAMIDATPTTTLVDEKVNIKLSGLDPGSKVTVRSYLPEPGMIFEAHAHFVVDDTGEVSVVKDPAVGGTYTDVEPMGLFWSMQRYGLRFVKKDVSKPMEVTLSVHKSHLDMSTLQNDIPISTTRIYRSYMGPDVETLEVHSGRIRGRVFKPKGPGPFRGIIDIYGVEGGMKVFKAALFASRGFAVYALPYLNYEDLPTDVTDLDLEYFEEATDWLQRQPYVQQGGVGVCGSSWGGEKALLMATHFPLKISACMSISGCCIRTIAPITYKGKTIPCQGYNLNRLKVAQSSSADQKIMSTLDVSDPVEKAPAGSFIELEKAQRLLFCVGLDDRFWNIPEVMDVGDRRLKAMGCSNYEIMRYPKTGHQFDPPYAPITLVSYIANPGFVTEWGGSPREHQRSQEDVWRRVLNFFNTYVGTKSISATSKL